MRNSFESNLHFSTTVCSNEKLFLWKTKRSEWGKTIFKLGIVHVKESHDSLMIKPLIQMPLKNLFEIWVKFLFSAIRHHSFLLFNTFYQVKRVWDCSDCHRSPRRQQKLSVANNTKCNGLCYPYSNIIFAFRARNINPLLILLHFPNWIQMHRFFIDFFGVQEWSKNDTASNNISLPTYCLSSILFCRLT